MHGIIICFVVYNSTIMFIFDIIFDECLTCWRNGQAPRRQCCKIINGTQGGGVVDSVVQVQIRECNRFESVTPP